MSMREQYNSGQDNFRFGSISCFLLCFWLSPVICQLDTSVCTPNTKGGTRPLPVLPDNYAANIKWTSMSDHWTYYVREDFDTVRQKAALRISLPLLVPDAKVIYDLTHGYISIFEDVTSQKCQVHQPDGRYYTFNNLLWLSSLYQMLNHVRLGKDVIYEGETTLDGVNVAHFSACLYEYELNRTAFYNMYYIDNSNPQKSNWVLPHITGREPFSIFPYYITIDIKGHKYNGKVQGQVSFDINPSFEDESFLPAPGAWCEGLPLTSLPAFPTQFSAMSEVVDLDFKKVSYEWLWFDSEARLVRWDWKDVDNSHGSNNPDPFSFVYDYNIGVKYSIDKNLETCSLPSFISLSDDYSTKTGKDRGPIGQQFKMDEDATVFFHKSGIFHQKIGRQTIRGVPCDLYIGLYYDEVTGSNFTLQWYFTARGWSINSDQVLTVGALFRIELWRGASQNPIVRNILRYSPVAPYHEVFDVSLCYTATQKIHFVMLVTVGDPSLFAQVTRRTLKELLLSVLDQFIVENNRFSPLELDYDGHQTLFVYTSMLERVPLDNPNTVHSPQHTMESAYNFLEGSIRSHTSYTVRTINGKLVTLVPKQVYRIDFNQDFTTPTPPSPTTTPILIAPSKRHSTTTTTTTSTPTPTTTTTTTTTTSTSAQIITYPTTASAAIATHPQPPQPSTRRTGAIQTSAPFSFRSSTTGDTKSVPCASSQHGSDANKYTIGSLVGGMIGFLVLGLVLGFVGTRIYHVKRLISPVPLFQKGDDI